LYTLLYLSFRLLPFLYLTEAIELIVSGGNTTPVSGIVFNGTNIKDW
jgi:hypothetical protein